MKSEVEKDTIEGGRQQGTDGALYLAFRERAIRSQQSALGKGLTRCSGSKVQMLGREEASAGGQELTSAKVQVKDGSDWDRGSTTQDMKSLGATSSSSNGTPLLMMMTP